MSHGHLEMRHVPNYTMSQTPPLLLPISVNGTKHLVAQAGNLPAGPAIQSAGPDADQDVEPQPAARQAVPPAHSSVDPTRSGQATPRGLQPQGWSAMGSWTQGSRELSSEVTASLGWGQLLHWSRTHETGLQLILDSSLCLTLHINVVSRTCEFYLQIKSQIFISLSPLPLPVSIAITSLLQKPPSRSLSLTLATSQHIPHNSRSNYFQK